MQESTVKPKWEAAPWYAYLAALLASGVAFVVFVGLLLVLDLSGGGATLAAFAVCGLFGVLTTVLQPNGSWLLGICASATLAGFLAYVATTLALQGRFDVWPAFEAVGALAFAAGGALAGRRIRR